MAPIIAILQRLCTSFHTQQFPTSLFIVVNSKYMPSYSDPVFGNHSLGVLVFVVLTDRFETLSP